MSTALIVVDVQNDFCEGGSLAVEGGDLTARKIDRYIDLMGDLYDLVVFTQDWHNDLPDTNGGHFDEWPVHCVADTDGARLHEVFDGIAGSRYVLVRKGQGTHGYSGFEGKVVSSEHTLDSFFKYLDINNVDVCGIAGDYCVRATALDAVKNGYLTTVLPSLVASVGGDEATREVVAQVEAAQR